MKLYAAYIEREIERVKPTIQIGSGGIIPAPIKSADDLKTLRFHLTELQTKAMQCPNERTNAALTQLETRLLGVSTPTAIAMLKDACERVNLVNDCRGLDKDYAVNWAQVSVDELRNQFYALAAS